MMDGVIVVDKKEGKTSHDIVSEVRKLLGVKKAGHTGTLDPMATGVLPVCLNEATKLAGFLTGEDKEYRATMLIGVQTDTMDIEGKIIRKSGNIVSAEAITNAVSEMIGNIKQVPPAYSAVKFRGKPLYKWARDGVFLKKEPRDVIIHDIVIEDISFPIVTFRVVCSKGTYIRTLCSDIGDKLGPGACLSALRRLKSGFFSENNAVSLIDFTDKDKRNELAEKIMPMNELLPFLATVELQESSAEKLRNGWQPSVEMMQEYELPLLKTGDMVKFVSGGYLLAVAKMLAPVSNLSEFDGKMQAAKIVRVFNAGK
jgi:tRNA pseudouridine55 synthase